MKRTGATLLPPKLTACVNLYFCTRVTLVVVACKASAGNMWLLITTTIPVYGMLLVVEEIDQVANTMTDGVVVAVLFQRSTPMEGLSQMAVIVLR